MPNPYDGLRVVELAGDPAGELVGKLLADMGAGVVKLEPAEGSPTRHIGPYADDVVDPEASLTFWYYNTGKRSRMLPDDAEQADRELSELVADADVLISTMGPRALRDQGIDLRALTERHERLIVLSVTPFGLTGPWADWRTSDLVGLAAGGLLNSCGYDDHTIPPVRPGGDQGFHTAASFAHSGVLLALLDRQRTGRGQLVDVSMHESMAITVELANPYWFYPRVLVQRQTCRHAQPAMTQPALFKCRDDRWIYFVLIVAEAKPWQTLVEWLDDYGLAVDLRDPAYSDVAYRQANFAYIQDLVECLFLLQDAEQAYFDGQRRQLPLGILNAPEDVLEDVHLRERGFFVDVPMGGGRLARFPGAPYRFSAFGPEELRPAPRLGEANLAEVSDG